jgi:hypothetical protein
MMLRITNENMRVYLINVIAALLADTNHQHDKLIAQTRLMLQMLED